MEISHIKKEVKFKTIYGTNKALWGIQGVKTS